MRKIWGLRRDKERDKDKEREKRRSFTGSSSLYNTTSNQTLIRQSNDDYDSNSINPSLLTSQSTVQPATLSIHSRVRDDESTLASSVETHRDGQHGHRDGHSHGHRDHKDGKDGRPSVDGPRRTKSVHGLVKHEYDAKTVKNSWVNVVVNTSVNDVDELTMRLYRAELKGSHLYLFKPNLSYKNFRVGETRDDITLPGTSSSVKNLNIHDLDLVSISGPTTIAVPPPSINAGPQSAPLLSSSPTSQYHTQTAFAPPAPLALERSQGYSPLQPPEMFKNNNSSSSSIPENNMPSILTPTPKGPESSANADDYRITYWDSAIPHPDLRFNFDNSTFQPDCSMESMVHFSLFMTDETHLVAVNQVINVLPIFPDFGKSMRLINDMLNGLFHKKFNGDYQLNIIIERVFSLLSHVSNNFKGFLLKSDVAPYILRLLEILGDHLNLEEDIPQLEELQAKLKSLKSTILSHQQGLLALASDSLDHVPETNPFKDLNGNFFLNKVNLIEFASVINDIDLQFFKQWNSNIDKSLLLYSTINQSYLNNNSVDILYRKNPLFFNNEHHMHYLSRLIISHLFQEPSGPNNGTSSLEFKARLLEKWIDLGCLLDKSGNMSSWLGIASVIISQPVLRLSKIWSFVSSDYIKLLKNDWSPVLFELDRRYLVNSIASSTPNSPHQNPTAEDIEQTGDSYHIMAPRGLGKIYQKEHVIPYFGDLLLNNLSTKNINELDSTFKKINYSFNRWNDYFKNLVNYNDIIKYNDDVLKRYDMMGFIFSNESLNQVLYFGVNENSKSLPSTFEISKDDNHVTGLNFNINVNQTLKNQLLKMIDLNSSGYSFNLEKLMLLSLGFQPELPEAYLHPNVPFYKNLPLNHSNMSLHSADSSQSSQAETPANVHDPFTKLPTFNNNNFKFNLLKYDELASESGTNGFQTDNKDSKHNIKLDNDLVFRIDDFVNDVEGQPVSGFNALDEVDNEDDDEEVAGLGIDVDDILNSDKFNNFSMSNGSSTNDSESNHASSAGNGNQKPTSNPFSQPTNSFSVVSSDSSQLQIYKYIPKFANIDRLIDLLIVDSKYLDESINIDLSEYRFVFLLSYTSYITTRELLDKLAHRFINSGNAVISIMKKLHALKNNQYTRSMDHDFPSWEIDRSVDLSILGDVDYSVLLRIQINILKVLVLLINNFYSNFAMDLVNKKILIKLLKLFSNEILQWYNSNKIDAKLEKSFESLVNYYKKLKKLFVKKTYRPIELGKFNEFLVNDFKFSNSLHEVPMNRNLPGHKNVHKIEKFLHKFNKLLTIFYKGIKVEDWIKIYKILEIEFEKNNLMEFSLQKVDTSDENLIISNIFNYLDTLNDPNEKSLILKKFPLVFRKLFKLYNKFKSYILIQLTDLNITVDERLDRMKTLLYMVKICQLKMLNNHFVFESRRKGNIPSCVESAIANVIYSPESRLFTNLWIKASIALNGDDSNEISSLDDLNTLLPKRLTIKDLAMNHEFLLPCFGWVIENLLEMNKITNFNNRNLINFNKRYFIFKVLKELSMEESSIDEEFNHNDTREFEFLLKLDENLINNKNIKEFTLLEKDRVKLFKTVLKDQHKILIVDNRKKQLKDSLTRDTNGGNASNNSQLSLNPSLNKKSSNSTLKRQSLSYKQQNSGSRFKISGLFNKSRPFSIGGGNNGTLGGSSHQLSNERSALIKDLPNPVMSIDSKQKPAYVITLKNKKIFPVYLQPLSFKIDNESATKDDDFFFQCLNESDLNDWLMKLNYANKHWFFSRSLNIKSSTGHYLTFGIPIGVVCNRQNTLAPKFLIDMFNEIETEGIKDVGVYRISTSLSELSNLKSMIDRVGFIDFEEKSYDTHALTSCVKSYFRELPDALIPDKAIESFFYLRQTILNEGIEEKAILLRYQEILKDIPVVNYETLKVLIQHLKKVVEFSEINKMTTTNIATVIGPALTEASNLELLVQNFGFMNFILEKMIVNYNAIFELSKEEIENMEIESQEKQDIETEEVAGNSAEELDEDRETVRDVNEEPVEAVDNTIESESDKHS